MVAVTEKFPWDPIAEARRQWASHGWRSAADGMAAVTSIMRAQQVILGRVDKALKPYGITFSRYEVLMLLYFSRAGKLPMRKIGQRLQVHPTSVTNAIDRLEAAGLVQRGQHPTDRRTILIELLPAGRDLAMEATAALNKEVFDDPGLKPEQLQELWAILADLRQSAGDFKAD
jgi:DNA-binding MarR family transcriptional regulator